MAKIQNYGAFVAVLMAGTAMPVLAQTTNQAPTTVPVPGTADTSGQQTGGMVQGGGVSATTTVASAAGPQSEDIIVTAQRRSESLQRVPVAVTVLSADLLAKQNITSENDLQFSTPGLQVRTGSSATQVNFAVRGQSFDQFSGTRPGVLPYFNEVQASSSIGGGGGTTAFYDLQSIQLLKGPQGTLFGRNATGGAVLFTTAKPDDTLGGYAAVRGGDYRTKQAEGAINVPIVEDTLLTRVAGFYGDNRGYQTNLEDGSHPGGEKRYGLRGSVTFKTGSLRNDLVVDYYHSNGSSVTAALFNVNPAGAAASLYSPAFPLYPVYVTAKHDPNIDPAGLSSYFNNTQAKRGPYTIASDSANVYQARNVVITNATSLDLSEGLTLRNIFGYSRFKSVLANDSDGSPYGIAGSSIINPTTPAAYNTGGTRLEQDGLSRQYSDEVQLQGNATNLAYTVGFFFSDEQGTVYRPSEFFDILRLVGPPSVTYSNDRSKHRTYAGYAQGTYELGDMTGIQGLAATVGLRYTSEQVRAITLPLDSVYGLALTNPALYNNNQKRTIDNVSWNLGLKDQITSEFMIYANSRRSYKNGGFNSDEAPQNGYAATGGNSYRTETLTDAELGSKYQGHAGEMPVRANLAVFHDWITDSQRTAFATVAGNPAAITVNVPKARVYGVELDGSINPADWLSMGGSVDYTHARFTSQIAAIAGGTGRFATYPDTPEWSGTLFAEATVPISGDIEGTLRGDMYAQKSTFFSSSAQNNPGARLPGYALANFRIGIQDTKAGWSLSALLKNAFDRTYYTGGIALGELLGFNTAIPGAPRQFSVEARLKF